MEFDWHIFDRVWNGAYDLFGLVIAAPPPVAAAVLGAPVLLALASRNALSSFGAILFIALSAAAFRHPLQGSDGTLFGCTAYVGAVLIALQGFSESRKARAAKLLIADVEEMRRDMSDFLSALERRARTVDEFHLRKTTIDAE